MSSKIIFLVLASLIMLAIVIFGINMALKKGGTVPMIYRAGSQAKEQAEQPVEKNKALESESAVERELPVQGNEPLLN